MISTPLSDIMIMEGLIASIVCQTEECVVDKLIQWYKDDEEILESDRAIKIESAGNIHKLTFQQIALHHKGKYKILINRKHCSQANLDVIRMYICILATKTNFKSCKMSL